MPLDPQVQPMLDALNSLELPPLRDQDPVAVRQGFTAMWSGADLEDVAEVRDVTVAGGEGDRPARLYHPGGDDVPLVVWFHGGGWMIGDLESHKPQCRALANRAQAAVLAVDYRLAPEHPFPAALDDAIAATRWVHAHADELGTDPDRTVVAGDSAGGNLAAVVAQELRGSEVPLAAQVLIYPVTDCDLDTSSYRENAEGFYLHREHMETFFHHYVPDADARTDPRVSPLRADDLSGLPPAVVVTAGHDPLRDEGDAYADAMRDAGVEVVHLQHPDQVHGFMGYLGTVDAASRAWDDVVASVRPWLEPSAS